MSTPQELLDQLHEVDIPALFSPDFPTKKARIEQIKIARQKIRLIKSRLKQEQDDIKARWDGRNKWEGQQERLHLVPYNILSDMIKHLEITISELVNLPANSQLPPVPGFRKSTHKYIFGDIQAGEWGIGNVVEAKVWQLEFHIRKLFIKRAKITSQMGVTFFWAIPALALAVGSIAGFGDTMSEALTGDSSWKLAISVCLWVLTMIGVLMIFSMAYKRSQVSTEILKAGKLLQQVKDGGARRPKRKPKRHRQKTD